MPKSDPMMTWMRRRIGKMKRKRIYSRNRTMTRRTVHRTMQPKTLMNAKTQRVSSHSPPTERTAT